MNARLFARAMLPLLAAILGCRGGSDTTELPKVAIDSIRYLGTSVTGPRAVSELAAANFVAERSPSVRIRVERFGSEPQHELASIENRVQRIVALDRANELEAVLGADEAGYSVVGSRAATDYSAFAAAAPGSTNLLDESFALAPDVTLSLRWRPETASKSEVDWSFDVSNLGTGTDGKPRLRATLVHARMVRSAESLAPTRQRQALVLHDAPAVDGDAMLFLYVPGSSDPSTYAILIEATSPPADTSAHRADVEKSAAEAKLAAERVAAGEASDPIAALADLFSDYRRGAIVRLAMANDAAITGDFALAADDAVIEEFCKKAAESRKGAPPLQDLGFELERFTLRFLADKMGSTAMPEALAVVLVRHAGESGRFASALEDAATTATSLAALEQRFIDQNRSFLEDRSPSSRVRAFEWLADRGKAPPGFEPLAPLADRKKVLRAAEEAEAAKDAAVRSESEGGAK